MPDKTLYLEGYISFAHYMPCSLPRELYSVPEKIGTFLEQALAVDHVFVPGLRKREA